MNKIFQTEFDLQVAKIKVLDGYDNLNYLIITPSEKYIFKTYKHTQQNYDIVEAESETLLALQESNKYPKPIPFLDGSFVKILNIKGEALICRLLSFIEGDFFGDLEPTEKLYQSLGVFLAEMDVKLKTVSNYVIKARQWEWDTQYLDLNKQYIAAIPNASDRHLVQYFFQQYNEVVQPLAPKLRKQTIHNDANEWNILTKNGEVSGIIDYGDLAHSFLINELAIAIAYACYDIENPLAWSCIIIKAYHRILPLEAQEIKVLYYLIAARLVISVCNSAHSKQINPNNTYTSVSEKPAWRMLYHWLSINPIAAENAFSRAIGLEVDTPKPANEIIKDRHKYISPVLSLSYVQPIYMKRSAFQYMYDAYGNTFLDSYNNIPHVGHSHPKVVAAGQRQMAKLNTNTRYLYDELSGYSKKLLSKFPNTLNKVFFVNSGSAASDLAIRIAKAHTGLEHVMVMEYGYHGNTQIGIDISDYKFNNPKGQGQRGHIIKTEIPDTYRGTYTNNDGTAGKKYAERAIQQISTSNSPIATFIAEPIVGCGGQVPLAKDYLKHVYRAIRDQGGVCISDEVQTGFGRLGDHFWGFQLHDVVPDIVVLGKPMANGHPMGAVVCRSDIAESFSNGVEFFSSFGGNPVSCAIASSVLEVIEEEALQEKAKIVGNYYKSHFLRLQKQYSCIGDVRGSGLFLGVELIKDDTLKPNTELAQHIKNELRKRHVLISTDGYFDSVLKIKPPLCFTKENAEYVIKHIEQILQLYTN